MTADVFTPDWTSPLIETVRRILTLAERDESELPMLLQVDGKQLRRILEGDVPLPLSVARKLSENLGGTIGFWMNRDDQFRSDTVRIAESRDKWLRSVPLADLIAHRWVSERPRKAEVLEVVLSYFGVRSVSEWKYRWSALQEAALFRRSKTVHATPEAVASWLRRGELQSELSDEACFSSEELRRILPDIRSLVRTKPSGALVQHLSGLLAKAGVHLVIARTPTKCPLSGAAWITHLGSAVIMLSLRHKTDDHFWFTLFHEIAHLVLHRPQQRFILDDDVEMLSGTDVLELEANSYALDILIPHEFREELQQLSLTRNAIVKFAQRLTLPPGVIVGQLQHLERLGPAAFRNMKREFSFSTLEI